MFDMQFEILRAIILDDDDLAIVSSPDIRGVPLSAKLVGFVVFNRKDQKALRHYPAKEGSLAILQANYPIA